MTNLSLNTTVNKVSLVVNETSYTLVLTPTVVSLSLTLNYGLPEAPDDAKLYVRKSKAWYEIVLSLFITDAPSDNKQYARKNAAWEEVSAPSVTKEDITGLKLADSPEFANVQITNLTTDATAGGVIPVTIWTWLGSTAKSVLSVLSNLISKVYYLYPQTALTFTGSIDLSKVDSHYSDYTQTGILNITIASGAIIGGSAEITITANGSAMTVTGATQYGDTAIDYTASKINLFIFHYFTHGIYYTVKQLN